MARYILICDSQKGVTIYINNLDKCEVDDNVDKN